MIESCFEFCFISGNSAWILRPLCFHIVIWQLKLELFTVQISPSCWAHWGFHHLIVHSVWKIPACPQRSLCPLRCPWEPCTQKGGRKLCCCEHAAEHGERCVLGYGAERSKLDGLKALLRCPLPWKPPPFLCVCRGMLDAHLLWSEACISELWCRSASEVAGAVPAGAQGCLGRAASNAAAQELACSLAASSISELLWLPERGSKCGALSGLLWCLESMTEPHGTGNLYPVLNPGHESSFVPWFILL